MSWCTSTGSPSPQWRCSSGGSVGTPPTLRSLTTPTHTSTTRPDSRPWRGIGVEEKRLLDALATHRTVSTTQIIDLDHHRLVDVVEGRSRDVLAASRTARGSDGCNQIPLATLDPAAGYRAALVEHLSNATLVVDHFHAIKPANAANDDVHRRVQHEQLGRRGHKTDPVDRARRVFAAMAAPPSPWAPPAASKSNIQAMRSSVSRSKPVTKELLREICTASDAGVHPIGD